MRKSYLKKSLKRFQGYIPGEQPQEKGWIKLNTNENPYPPSPKVLSALKKALNEPLQMYPDPLCFEFRKVIAQLYNLDIDQIFVGNGSDEILRVILETFLDKNEKVIYPFPSYPLYQTLTEIQTGKSFVFPLTHEFDLPEWNKRWKGKILFLANPNSPTGNLLSYDKIKFICEKFPGIIVIDEAYVDFAAQSCLELVKKYPNVIVSRSLSKSYSLAGMRIGYALGSKEIIAPLYLVITPGRRVGERGLSI